VKLALAEAVNLYGNGLLAHRRRQSRLQRSRALRMGGLPGLRGNRRITATTVLHQLCDSIDTPDYVSYSYAADMVRSTAGFLAEQRGRAALLFSDTGAGCEPAVLAVKTATATGSATSWRRLRRGARRDCTGNHSARRVRFRLKQTWCAARMRRGGGTAPMQDRPGARRMQRAQTWVASGR